MATDALDLVHYSLDPSALILGEPHGGLASAVAAAGFRVLGELPLAEAEARLDRQADVDLLVATLSADGGATMDRVLDRIAAGARAGDHRALVVLPPELIDAVAARFPGDEAALLVDPAPLELAFALTVAARPPAQAVHDIGSEGGSHRLIELSEEVGRLARQLAALAGERPRAAPVPVPPPPPDAGDPTSATALRRMIRARRLRDQFFRADLFADPAWDILLDLAAAAKEGRRVPVSSLCIAAAVPPTTALRWIRALTDDGLLVRRADPHDGRRVFVALSDETAAAVDACVAAMGRAAAS